MLCLRFALISFLLAAAPVFAANNNNSPENNGALPMAELQQFTDILDEVKDNYVSEVDDKTLFENAIKGMLSGLDPHSAYLDAEDFDDLKVSTSGKFGGLGIEVSMDNGLIKVISPIDDTPASRAGIKAGDLIVRLNETPVKGLSLKDAVNMMRGEKGSSIQLTILREGMDKPLKLNVTRDVINVVSVKQKILAPNYGYLRITNFQNHTADDARKGFMKLQKDNKSALKGLIIDLRNNPGGVLEGAVDVSNLFLDSRNIGYDKLIVYTQGREPASRMDEKANGNDISKDIPIVVLVNQGSASAAEIVAGALQDHHRAILLGTKTFGKGSVQTVLPLSEHSALKLTTALYYTPKGRSIQAEGIEPDVLVKDLTIPTQPKVDTDIYVSESDLQGHLRNNDKSAKKANTDDDKDLDKTDEQLKTDYQLQEGLNLLKGLTAYTEKLQ